MVRTYLFLIVPLSLALLALLVAWVLVWRKSAYLRKLTPEAHQVGDTWLHDMAPEMVGWFRAVPWRQSMHHMLVGFEKALRRVRSAMSVLDRASDRMARRVRRVHQEGAREVEKIEQERLEAQAVPEHDLDDIDMDDPDQLKQEEQRLIVAIAQSPKEPELYSDLARVYVKLENLADAVEALKAARKLDPENENYEKRLERVQKRLEMVKARE